MNEKLFELLKTKASPLGFNSDELKTVAEALSKSLKQDGELQSEDVLNGLVEMAMPALEASQKVANRVVTKKQKELDELKQSIVNQPKDETPKKEVSEKQENSEIKELTNTLRSFMEQTNQRFDKLDTIRVSKSRREVLESVVKDSGLFGQRAMKEFDRMKFDNDEEFESFINDTKSDLEAYNKEMSAKGLPSQIGGTTSKGKQELLTQAQVDNIANMY